MGCDTLPDNSFLGRWCFNPRTHMGCDVLHHHDKQRKREFQSTHPHGVRPNRVIDRFNIKVVSIHAPTWGATIATLDEIPFGSVFQSTHPHGVRLLRVFLLLPRLWFESRRPGEVRLGVSFGTIGFLLFQSTHPHGVRRLAVLHWIHLPQVSIHAPTWGATLAST